MGEKTKVHRKGKEKKGRIQQHLPSSAAKKKKKKILSKAKKLDMAPPLPISLPFFLVKARGKNGKKGRENREGREKKREKKRNTKYFAYSPLR